MDSYPTHRPVAAMRPEQVRDCVRLGIPVPHAEIEAARDAFAHDLRETRHIVIGDEPGGLSRFLRGVLATIRAMPRDVPEAVALLIADIREKPHSHALVALVTFIVFAFLPLVIGLALWGAQ